MNIGNEIWNIVRPYNPREKQEQELRELESISPEVSDYVRRHAPQWYLDLPEPPGQTS
jgi:hypothetical protein